jgi:transmembrane sensor
MQSDARIEQLRHLLQKYSEGKISLKEQIELSEQLADKKNTIAKQTLLDDWKIQLESDRILDRNFDLLLDKVHHRIRLNESSNKPNFSFWNTFQRVAAILIFPLLLSFLAYLYYNNANRNNEPGSYAEIQCPLGVRTKFQLPDGSTGFLNSGSSLKYPVSFTSERTVELSGEAFFNVTHNKEIPFHVNTKNLDIKVLGTTFNVICNEDEKTEEIVLQTGKVDVLSKSGNQLAEISPNEQLTLNIEKQTFTKKIVEASQYSTWKDGKLVFRNENMQQLARRLSRWYNAEVIVGDTLLEGYTFHATFIDEPLDEVMKLIAITTPISYNEEARLADKNGAYQKRKIRLQTNQSKISHFK